MERTCLFCDSLLPPTFLLNHFQLIVHSAQTMYHLWKFHAKSGLNPFMLNCCKNALDLQTTAFRTCHSGSGLFGECPKLVRSVSDTNYAITILFCAFDIPTWSCLEVQTWTSGTLYVEFSASWTRNVQRTIPISTKTALTTHPWQLEPNPVNLYRRLFTSFFHLSWSAGSTLLLQAWCV